MKTKKTGLLLSGALLLTVLYAAIAFMQNNFVFPNFEYERVFGFFMKSIPSLELQSQLWKLLFLFPAVFLCAVAAARSGIKIQFPKIINYRKTIAIILIAATAVILLSIRFLFQETEIADDENAYDFQAQTLLAGRLVNPPPPVINNFRNTFIISDSRIWVGKYNIGHGAFIALGMMLGNRYIITVTLSILTLLLIYLIGLELYGNRKLAFIVLCLGAVSPFFYLISSTRLSHTTSAFLLAFFMYLFLRMNREKRMGYRIMFSFLSGFCLGYALNIRPLTALGFFIPFFFISIKDLFKAPVKWHASWIPLIAGTAAVVAFTLWYNALVTGNLLIFPFHYYSSFENVGFGTYGHNIFVGLRNLSVNIFRLNINVFGFAWSLILASAVLFAEKDYRDYLLFGIVGGIAGLYVLYYSPGISDVGPVYYYELMIPLLLLSGRGILFIKELLKKKFTNGGTFLYAFIILSFAASAAAFIPERIRHIARLTYEIREPYEAIKQAEIHNAVVLIKPFIHKGWVFGRRNSSPVFNDDIIYCRYSDSLFNSKLAECFPDRRFYVLSYDSTLSKFVVKRFE